MRTKISSSRGLSVFSLITRDLALLFLVDLMMSLGMNLTDSLRSLYIESLGATVLQISLVVSATGMAGTLMRVPSGLFSDNYGRKKIIIASILMAASPPFLYTLSRSWDQLIPWGLVYSSAFALYMPSRMALLADLTPVEQRTKVYSILGLAWPLGSILGPALAGVIQVTQGWAPSSILLQQSMSSAWSPVSCCRSRDSTRRLVKR
ncbi:MFS transporter [Candidatus Bathyarchaeota archaeon]|nr:MFS transporter [Candidatus Bathyarchaeota archaeon]